MSTHDTPHEPDGGVRDASSRREPGAGDSSHASDGPRTGPGPLPPPRGRRLDRRAENRVLAGVAGGLGDYFGVDPAIFRLAFVALALFGGSGFVLYCLGWLFLPVRGTSTTVGDDLIRRVGGGRSAGGLVLIAIAALVIIENTRVFGGGLVWAAILIGLGVLLFRGGSDDAARPGGGGGRGGGTPPPPADGGGAGDTSTVAAPSVPPDPAQGPDPADVEARSGARRTPPSAASAPADQRVITTPRLPDDGWRPTPLTAPPEPPAPPSVLGRATVAAALIMIGAAALLENLTDIELAGADYVALGLVVVGGGLVVGSRIGRARGLIALGAVGLLGLAVTSTVTSLPMGTVGEREHVPLTAEQIQQPYELGLGDMRIDLTELALEPGQRVDVEAEMAVGALEVEVPEEVGVVVDAQAQLGEVSALGRTSQGSDAATTFSEPGAEGSPTITLDLSVGMGEIVVQRAVDPVDTSDTLDTFEETN